MNLEERRIADKIPERETILIVDHQPKAYRFKGLKLLEVYSPGHDHNGKIYQARFSLYQIREAEFTILVAVDLPSSKRAERLNPATHVFTGTELSFVLEEVGRLDLMAHIYLPHWTGSCAMLDYDLSGSVKIQADLARGVADFFAACDTYEIWEATR